VVLKTQLGYWFFHRILAVHFLLMFVCFGITCNMGDVAVVLGQFVLIVFSSIMVWLGYAEIEHATINKSTEWIELKDALNRVVLNCSLKDVTDIEWENKNVTYNAPRFQNRSTNKKSFIVTFKNGYEWYAEGADYKNFFEVQGYLLTYCAKNEIIKVRPLAQRKRSRKRANPFKNIDKYYR